VGVVLSALAVPVGWVIASLGLSIEAWRWRKARWSSDDAAAAIDQALSTGGLMRTALAVEQGRVVGSTGVRAAVTRAAARLPAPTKHVVGRFRVPWPGLVGVIVALGWGFSFSRLGPSRAEHQRAVAERDGEVGVEGVSKHTKESDKIAQSDGLSPKQAGHASVGAAAGEEDDVLAVTGARLRGSGGAKGADLAVGAGGLGGANPAASTSLGGPGGGLAELGQAADPVSPVMGQSGDRRDEGAPLASGEPPSTGTLDAADEGDLRGPVEKTQADFDAQLLSVDGDFGRSHGDSIDAPSAQDLAAGVAPNLGMAMVTSDSDVAAPGIGGVNDSSGTSSAMTAPSRLEGVQAAEIWVQTAWQESSAGMVQTIQGGQAGGRSTVAYQAMLARYSAIAESAVRVAAIPPTRRAYIRRYFEAIRLDEDTP
jgi:hypothetical protein